MATCPKCGNRKLSKNKETKVKSCKRCGPLPKSSIEEYNKLIADVTETHYMDY